MVFSRSDWQETLLTSSFEDDDHTDAHDDTSDDDDDEIIDDNTSAEETYYSSEELIQQQAEEQQRRSRTRRDEDDDEDRSRSSYSGRSSYQQDHDDDSRGGTSVRSSWSHEEGSYHSSRRSIFDEEEGEESKGDSRSYYSSEASSRSTSRSRSRSLRSRQSGGEDDDQEEEQGSYRSGEDDSKEESYYSGSQRSGGSGRSYSSRSQSRRSSNEEEEQGSYYSSEGQGSRSYYSGDGGEEGSHQSGSARSQGEAEEEYDRSSRSGDERSYYSSRGSQSERSYYSGDGGEEGSHQSGSARSQGEEEENDRSSRSGDERSYYSSRGSQSERSYYSGEEQGTQYSRSSSQSHGEEEDRSRSSRSKHSGDDARSRSSSRGSRSERSSRSRHSRRRGSASSRGSRSHKSEGQEGGDDFSFHESVGSNLVDQPIFEEDNEEEQEQAEEIGAWPSTDGDTGGAWPVSMTATSSKGGEEDDDDAFGGMDDAFPPLLLEPTTSANVVDAFGDAGAFGDDLFGESSAPPKPTDPLGKMSSDPFASSAFESDTVLSSKKADADLFAGADLFDEMPKPSSDLFGEIEFVDAALFPSRDEVDDDKLPEHKESSTDGALPTDYKTGSSEAFSKDARSNADRSGDGSRQDKNLGKEDSALDSFAAHTLGDETMQPSAGKPGVDPFDTDMFGASVGSAPQDPFAEFAFGKQDDPMKLVEESRSQTEDSFATANKSTSTKEKATAAIEDASFIDIADHSTGDKNEAVEDFDEDAANDNNDVSAHSSELDAVENESRSESPEEESPLGGFPDDDFQSDGSFENVVPKPISMQSLQSEDFGDDLFENDSFGSDPKSFKVSSESKSDDQSGGENNKDSFDDDDDDFFGKHETSKNSAFFDDDNDPFGKGSKSIQKSSDEGFEGSSFGNDRQSDKDDADDFFASIASKSITSHSISTRNSRATRSSGSAKSSSHDTPTGRDSFFGGGEAESRQSQDGTSDLVSMASKFSKGSRSSRSSNGSNESKVSSTKKNRPSIAEYLPASLKQSELKSTDARSEAEPSIGLSDVFGTTFTSPEGRSHGDSSTSVSDKSKESRSNKESRRKSISSRKERGMKSLVINEDEELKDSADNLSFGVFSPKQDSDPHMGSFSSRSSSKRSSKRSSRRSSRRPSHGSIEEELKSFIGSFSEKNEVSQPTPSTESKSDDAFISTSERGENTFSFATNEKSGEIFEEEAFESPSQKSQKSRASLKETFAEDLFTDDIFGGDPFVESPDKDRSGFGLQQDGPNEPMLTDPFADELFALPGREDAGLVAVFPVAPSSQQASLRSENEKPDKIGASDGFETSTSIEDIFSASKSDPFPGPQEPPIQEPIAEEEIEPSASGSNRSEPFGDSYSRESRRSDSYVSGETGEQEDSKRSGESGSYDEESYHRSRSGSDRSSHASHSSRRESESYPSRDSRRSHESGSYVSGQGEQEETRRSRESTSYGEESYHSSRLENSKRSHESGSHVSDEQEESRRSRESTSYGEETYSSRSGSYQPSHPSQSSRSTYEGSRSTRRSSSTRESDARSSQKSSFIDRNQDSQAASYKSDEVSRSDHGSVSSRSRESRPSSRSSRSTAFSDDRSESNGSSAFQAMDPSGRMLRRDSFDGFDGGLPESVRSEHSFSPQEDSRRSRRSRSDRSSESFRRGDRAISPFGEDGHSSERSFESSVPDRSQRSFSTEEDDSRRSRRSRRSDRSSQSFRRGDRVSPFGERDDDSNRSFEPSSSYTTRSKRSYSSREASSRRRPHGEDDDSNRSFEPSYSGRSKGSYSSREDSIRRRSRNRKGERAKSGGRVASPIRGNDHSSRHSYEGSFSDEESVLLNVSKNDDHKPKSKSRSKIDLRRPFTVPEGDDTGRGSHSTFEASFSSRSYEHSEPSEVADENAFGYAPKTYTPPQLEAAPVQPSSQSTGESSESSPAGPVSLPEEMAEPRTVEDDSSSVEEGRNGEANDESTSSSAGAEPTSNGEWFTDPAAVEDQEASFTVPPTSILTVSEEQTGVPAVLVEAEVEAESPIPATATVSRPVTTLRELGITLSTKREDVYVSIRNEGYLKAVEAAYMMLLELRPRIRYMLSLAEWNHIHVLMLYARVFDCELAAARIVQPEEFRIQLPGNLQVLEPLAVVLESIGIVEDASSGVRYVPVAKPLHNKKQVTISTATTEPLPPDHQQYYQPPDPDDVTEFLEWTQYHWNSSWIKVEQAREARKVMSAADGIQLPEKTFPENHLKLLEWEHLALEKWLGWDENLWFSYDQTVRMLGRKIQFVDFPKTSALGTYAWLLPRQVLERKSSTITSREKRTMEKVIVRIPKPTLHPEVWMIALLFDLSALPEERTATWYHKTNPVRDPSTMLSTFLRSAIAD